MKKGLVILILLIVLFACVYLICTNYNGIVNYLNNKEWALTESIGSVELSNYYMIEGIESNLIVVGNNYIKGYSNDTKNSFDENINLKSAVVNSNGDYCIIGEKDGTKICLINSDVKLWESEIQGSILDVTVNKNGYSAIIYKQTGYKSLIKVLKPDGTELFTNYLASTYAIDAELSNDNKMLAIAEVDTEGIKIQSNIKLININNLENEEVIRLPLGEEVLVDIEYNSKNDLLIQTDSSIKYIEDGLMKDIVPKIDNNVTYASIENETNPITISKVENGLFDTNYKLTIYEQHIHSIGVNEYELEKMPSLITASNKNIALLLENELLIINTNGNLVKKCNISGNIMSLKFFDNGNSIGLIYRNKIEFIKI